MTTIECRKCPMNEKCICNPTFEECHIRKDSYNKAIDVFVEKFIYKAVCEGCSGCCNCYEECRQSECEDWKTYIKIAEQLKR